MISRRYFLKGAGLWALGLGTLPTFARRLIAAPAAVPASKKTLVLLFQRGAMDGLSMLPPLGDPGYFDARPNLALRRDGNAPAIALNGDFGLHPALEPLKKWWDEGTLAFVSQVGSPDSTRSHFDAQDFMELGTPGRKNTPEGFLNRAAALVPGAKASPLSAIAMQPTMPRALAGAFPAIAMGSLRDFDIKGPQAAGSAHGFEALYQQAADRVFRGTGQEELFDAMRVVREVAGVHGGAEEKGARRNPLARRLREIALLIKADVGLRLAVTDMGGWDTHVNQGSDRGQLADRFRQLAEAMELFVETLGPRFADVVFVTVTEFGRTVKENGNRGTDHGHGSTFLALGGGVRGKQVVGAWKPLTAANLFEGRDLPVTTDFRAVLGELLAGHLGVKETGTVFPEFKGAGRLGLLRG